MDDGAEPGMDDLRLAWAGEPPPDQVAAYRRLGSDKRAVALKRIAVLQRLSSGLRPTRVAQAAAAAELGVGLKRMQAMLRSWRVPDIAAIVPGAVTVRRRTAPARGVGIARRIAAKAVARNPVVAEPTVRRRIAAVCARLGLAVPARMTVRRLLIEAKRTDGPLALPVTEPTVLPPPRPGEVLVVAREIIAARIADASEPTKPAEVLLLADAATGYLLAVVPVSARQELGRAAAEQLRHMGPTMATAWRPTTTIVIGSPSSAAGWEAQLTDAADRHGIAVSRETRRRTARWTAGLLWRGTDDLAPISTLSEQARASLPLLDQAEFTDAVTEAVDRHNGLIEDALDASSGSLDHRAPDGVVETAAISLLDILPSQSPSME